MEPGHEDREYTPEQVSRAEAGLASMEPGHEDREYTSSRPSAGRPASLNGARS